MTPFDRGMKFVLKVEGGWYDGTGAHDPNPTMQGITQKTYDHFRRGQGQRRRSVRLLAPDERDTIYRVLYWTKGRCEDLARKSEMIAIIHFDTCVNHGVGTPNSPSAGGIEILQRALRVNDDGIFGPITWQNYVNELMEDGEVPLANRYLDAREVQYRLLAKKAPETLGLNLDGWLARVAKLRKFLAL